MPNYKNSYITIGDFAFLQGIGRLYEGFVISLGYAYVQTDNISPPNQRGFTHEENISPQFNRYTLVRNQLVDNSPEMIERSMNGISQKGEKLYTVQKGDTLTSIAQRYKISIEDLIRWNKIENSDKINIGQKLIISEESRDLLVDYMKNVEKFQMQQDYNYNLCFSGINNEESDDFSVSHLIEPGLIFLGAPIIPKHGGLAGGGAAGKWTSIASKSLRWTDRTIQSGLKTNAKLPAKSIFTRYLGTRGIGAAAGRAVPYVGWALTAWDVGFYLGENYGISKWGGFYRDYKERKRRKEFLETLLKEYEKNEKND